MKKKVKVAIIGAGAAGMASAVIAARQGADVALFEKSDRVGKKLLATGNGKCNLSNTDFSTDCYYCSDKEKLQKIFDVFSPWDTISFFESMGLMVKEKNHGLYPYSEQASTVLDVLRTELAYSGVRILPGTEIDRAVKKDGAGFVVRGGEGKEEAFDKLILAAGSPASLRGTGKSGYHIAEGFGHRIYPLAPGLVQLKSDESFCKALGGVRCHARLSLMVDGNEAAQESGEVQFTDYGISGIPVFQFSRQAAYALKEKKKVSVLADFFPDQDKEAFAFFTKLRYELLENRTLEEFLTGTLNKKVCRVLAKRCGLKPGMAVKEVGYEKISELMQMGRSFSLHISDVNSMENAQICAGGVDFGQIDAQMESKLVPGLFFAGEIVDVDGRCGGYNLQWAWSSGYVAGMNAAGCSTKEMLESMKKKCGDKV